MSRLSGPTASASLPAEDTREPWGGEAGITLGCRHFLPGASPLGFAKCQETYPSSAAPGPGQGVQRDGVKAPIFLFHTPKKVAGETAGNQAFCLSVGTEAAICSFHQIAQPQGGSNGSGDPVLGSSCMLWSPGGVEAQGSRDAGPPPNDSGGDRNISPPLGSASSDWAPNTPATIPASSAALHADTPIPASCAPAGVTR